MKRFIVQERVVLTEFWEGAVLERSWIVSFGDQVRIFFGFSRVFCLSDCSYDTRRADCRYARG